MTTLLAPSRGAVLLAGVVGSTAYGLATEHSDTDTLGVFHGAPADILWGVDYAKSVVSHDPDVVLHELGKYVRLALACNPTASELLWLDAYTVHTEGGAELVAIREAFLNERDVRNAYVNYAEAQFRKFESSGFTTFGGKVGGRTAKHARHMFRLLEQGRRLLTEGRIVLRVDDPGWYLEHLPTLGPYKMAAEFAKQCAELRDTRSVLPAESNYDLVRDTTVGIRKRALAAGTT